MQREELNTLFMIIGLKTTEWIIGKIVWPRSTCKQYKKMLFYNAINYFQTNRSIVFIHSFRWYVSDPYYLSSLCNMLEI